MEDLERLDKEEEKILKRIEDWMNHDIEAMISGGCNVSCATLLSIFIEVLGGIANGTLNDDDPQKSKARFLYCLRLPWVPRGYISLNDKLSREREDKKVSTKFFGVISSIHFSLVDWILKIIPKIQLLDHILKMCPVSEKQMMVVDDL